MSNLPNETLAKLNCLNKWLEDVYEEGTRLSTLLEREGVAASQVETLKREHLPDFIDGIVQYLLSQLHGSDGTRAQMAMIRYYGLVTGQKVTLQVIGDELQVTRERVRQIVKKRLRYFRGKKGKAQLQAKFAEIALSILQGTYQITPLEISEIAPATEESVTFLEKARQNYTRAYETWSHEEDEQLKQLVSEGRKLKEIMAIHQRGRGSIRSRIRKFRLIHPEVPLDDEAEIIEETWTPEEDEMITRMVNAGLSSPKIAAKMGRSRAAVRRRAKALGLDLKQSKKKSLNAARRESRWDYEDDQRLLQHYQKGEDYATIAHNFQRSEKEIQTRLALLRNRQIKQLGFLGFHPQDGEMIGILASQTEGPMLAYGEKIIPIPAHIHPGEITLAQAVELVGEN